MDDEFPFVDSNCGNQEAEEENGESQDHPEQRKNAARLQAIHHDFRKMEKSKRFYHIDAECLMRRQQASLDNLKSDNFALQQTINTYTITDYGKQLAKLMYEANRYTGLIEEETRRAQGLEAMIHDTKLHKMDAKKKMGGCMAVWEKHVTTQIHIQQNEDRIQKATVEKNIVQGHVKMLKDKMSQLTQELQFYTNVYKRLSKELRRWEDGIRECLLNMNAMYTDRNQHHDAISDLMEMADFKDIYLQWVSMKGWTTQESFPIKELGRSQLSISESEAIEDDQPKTALSKTKKTFLMGKMRKSGCKNLRSITKTHYAKRSRAGDNYRKWVEIKGFANVQDLMNIDNISDVLPLVLEAQTKNLGLFKHMQELVKEMDELDLAKQEHIFDKAVPLSPELCVDSKTAIMGSKKYEKDQIADHVVESLRHLMIDEETFLPVVMDVRKQILLVFKEAGCYIKEDDTVDSKSPPANQAPVLNIGKLFSSLEDFVDRISGTFG